MKQPVIIEKKRERHTHNKRGSNGSWGKEGKGGEREGDEFIRRYKSLKRKNRFVAKFNGAENHGAGLV